MRFQVRPAVNGGMWGVTNENGSPDIALVFEERDAIRIVDAINRVDETRVDMESLREKVQE